jgi:hypothetical protein
LAALRDVYNDLKVLGLHVSEEMALGPIGGRSAFDSKKKKL